MDEQVKEEQTTIGGERIIIVQNKPSNGLAAVFSFFIPGLGQLYKGNPGSGFVWLVITIGAYFMLLIPGFFVHLFCILSCLGDDTPKVITGGKNGN